MPVTDGTELPRGESDSDESTPETAADEEASASAKPGIVRRLPTSRSIIRKLPQWRFRMALSRRRGRGADRAKVLARRRKPKASRGKEGGGLCRHSARNSLDFERRSIL